MKQRFQPGDIIDELTIIGLDHIKTTKRASNNTNVNMPYYKVRCSCGSTSIKRQSMLTARQYVTKCCNICAYARREKLDEQKERGPVVYMGWN